MKNRSHFRPVRILIFFLLLIGLLPFGFWIVKSSTPLTVSVTGDAQGPDDNDLLLWPFRNLKTNFPDGDGGTGRRDFLVHSGGFSPRGDDDAAKLDADRIKDEALSFRYFLSDAIPVSDASHAVYRMMMEEFLHVKRTGWSVLYSREPAPIMEFIHEDGRKIVLNGEEDFDGTPPSGSYNNRKALIYQRIYQYIPSESSVAASSVNLHLTPGGLKKLEDEGIPATFPLLIEQKNPLIRTGFIAVDLTSPAFDTGSFSLSGKIWYRSRVSLFRNGSQESLYWRVAVPWIRDQIKTADAGGSTENPPQKQSESRFITKGNSFYRIDDRNSSPFFIKGINLGTALPGKWFTQFPEDELLYFNWFTKMKEMNFNTLRVYTLLPPSFYRALKLYNRKNSSDPLFLLQEIWPEEHPAENNYLGREYSETYWKEIRMNIDALHGNIMIPSRAGRAWGSYTNDVSPWLLGYLIGREMEPDEVIETNRLNPDGVYRGRFISAENGPATESWLAENCDLAVSYELDQYGSSRPVGIVSWPTLDVLHHPLEWKDPELNGRAPFNDKAEVDIRRITVTDPSFGGFFGAYHIYPNYPDFMNNQSSYSSYTDKDGIFRYGGYLEEFIQTRTGYPAIVAEYGLSTSKATAHINPDGYDHGGLSEKVQGDGIIRMTEAIRNTGYAGAVVFEWMDEWAKKTWTTEPFMIPYDRQALWHNMLDPEQNYGIMAMTGISHLGEKRYDSVKTGQSLTLWGDESWLYIRMTSPDSWKETGTVYIGLDTNNRTDGIRTIPSSPAVNMEKGIESLIIIDLTNGKAELFNAENYNFSTLRLSGRENDKSEFEKVGILVNRAYRDESGTLHTALTADWGRLEPGPLDEPVHSLMIDGNTLTVRLPWGLINVSDPSRGELLYDDRTFYSPPAADEIKTVKSEGIGVTVVIQKPSGRIELLPDNDGTSMNYLFYTWTPWDVPVYEMKEKKSVRDLAGYLGSF